MNGIMKRQTGYTIGIVSTVVIAGLFSWSIMLHGLENGTDSDINTQPKDDHLLVMATLLEEEMTSELEYELEALSLAATGAGIDKSRVDVYDRLSELAQDIRSGEVDIVKTNSYAAFMLTRIADGEVIASEGASASALIVPTSSSLQTVNDLQGRMIGMGPNFASSTYAQPYFELSSLGLSLRQAGDDIESAEDVQIRHHGPEVFDALQSGSIHAAIVDVEMLPQISFTYREISRFVQDNDDVYVVSPHLLDEAASLLQARLVSEGAKGNPILLPYEENSAYFEDLYLGR